ncbi:MAG: 2-iminobutanoate/2-iminopropanoate deaminase [Gaiellales bacterium]|jgi:2-iminobutanoate/2-iminopropanoate deaminase|nr:2-iminobutanoate/2-iminopropanoate deaminase [Gaiellales bacterium]
MSRRAVSVDVAKLGPYSPAIVAEGRFVYVSGQGALRDGRYEPGDGVGSETRLVLENLFLILTAAGCGPSDVVRCGVFLQDMADFEEMNAAYGAAFPDPPPARTTVQVAALPGGIRVEIDCVAVLPG